MSDSHAIPSLLALGWGTFESDVAIHVMPCDKDTGIAIPPHVADADCECCPTLDIETTAAPYTRALWTHYCLCGCNGSHP